MCKFKHMFAFSLQSNMYDSVVFKLIMQMSQLELLKHFWGIDLCSTYTANVDHHFEMNSDILVVSHTTSSLCGMR